MTKPKTKKTKAPKLQFPDVSFSAKFQPEYYVYFSSGSSTDPTIYEGSVDCMGQVIDGVARGCTILNIPIEEVDNYGITFEGGTVLAVIDGMNVEFDYDGGAIEEEFDFKQFAAAVRASPFYKVKVDVKKYKKVSELRNIEERLTKQLREVEAALKALKE